MSERRPWTCVWPDAVPVQVCGGLACRAAPPSLFRPTVRDMPDNPLVPTAADTSAAAMAALTRKVPIIGDALAIVVQDAYARRRAVAERTALDIVEQVGSVERLADRLAEDPQLEALFVEAVDAAARTGLRDKRRLLARVIGTAVLDDAKVEDGQLLVQALRELDAPHLRALEAIRRAYDGAGPVEPGDERGRAARDAALSAVTQDMSVPLRATLVRTGTVDLNKGFFGNSDIVDGLTEFGRTLLNDLRQADQAENEGGAH
jgi:hypothetical protein